MYSAVSSPGAVTLADSVSHDKAAGVVVGGLILVMWLVVLGAAMAVKSLREKHASPFWQRPRR